MCKRCNNLCALSKDISNFLELYPYPVFRLLCHFSQSLSSYSVGFPTFKILATKDLYENSTGKYLPSDVLEEL